jgi:hypothetical protein
MITYGKKNSNFLYRTRVTLDNIQKSPEIAAALAEKGFTAERIQEGLTLHGAAEQVFRTLVDKKRSWLAAGAGLTGKYQDVYAEYAGYIKRLRVEFREDPETMAALELEGKRLRYIPGFIEQATHFYGKLLNDTAISAKLLVLGLSPELLQASFDRFVEYQSMRSDYEKLYGESQKLVVEKNKAFRRLRNWLRALTEAAKVAFADNLQTLEEIGLFVRNNPKPADAGTETPVDTNTDTNTNSDTGTSS